MKSVTSLVLKKVTTIVCVFLRKAPTKNRPERQMCQQTTLFIRIQKNLSSVGKDTEAAHGL